MKYVRSPHDISYTKTIYYLKHTLIKCNVEKTIPTECSAFYAFSPRKQMGSERNLSSLNFDDLKKLE